MTSFKKFVDEKTNQLRVICRSQWDYLDYPDVRNWLDDNFGDDNEGKFYVMKILLNLIYYKRSDIEKLIEYGLNEKIYGEIIKGKLIRNCLKTIQHNSYGG